MSGQKCSQRPKTQAFFNKTSEVPSTTGSLVNSYLISDLEEFTDHWESYHFPGEIRLNVVETKRARRRVHKDSGSSRPEFTIRRERLVVIREIMAHAEAQGASLLENGEVSRDGLMLSDNEGESDHPEVKPTAAGYKWSPDDVLCLSCFSTIFRNLYYAWWLEERKTDRVEGELIFMMVE
jgi:hypothetical protein